MTDPFEDFLRDEAAGLLDDTPDVTKERVKDIIDQVSALDLPDGAHWVMVHERLGMEYGDVFDYIADDPGFFGAVKSND